LSSHGKTRHEDLKLDLDRATRTVEELQVALKIAESEKSSYEQKILEYSAVIDRHVKTLTEQAKSFDNYKKLTEELYAKNQESPKATSAAQTQTQADTFDRTLQLENSEVVQSLVEN